MTNVINTMGDMFIVVAVEHQRKLDGQNVRASELITIPITFNTLEEAKEWCEKVKVKNRDYLIFGCWNPALKLAGKVRQQIFQPAC